MQLIGNSAEWLQLTGYNGPRAECFAGPSRKARSREEDPELTSWTDVVCVEVAISTHEPYFYGYRLSYGGDQETIHYLDRPLTACRIAPRLGPERLIVVIIPANLDSANVLIQARTTAVLDINDPRYPSLIVP